jgi:putative ABC transport system permease protein
MIRNFFITAYRNILKYRAYSTINFIGLTCGITLALLVIAYVRSERSFDRFQSKADRLYRIKYAVPNGMLLATSPPPIAPLMKDYFKDVENAARVYRRNVSISRPLQPGSFEETDVLFADSAIVDMFSFSFLSGDPSTALKERFTVLITDEMAKKYFGDKDPIGETLIFSGKQPFKVTGVVKNFPETSHIRFHMLVPYDNMYDLESDATAQVLRQNLSINFVISHSYTYVLLKPGGSPESVDKGMPEFLKKHCPPRLQIGQVFTLMPLLDIHLKSTLLDEPRSTNSLETLYIFGGVGLLTLLIACINYINLSTAQSFARIKEIGIRKVLGSAKNQLIFQFLAESFLFCLVAFLLSFLTFDLTLPILNQFTGKHLLFSDQIDLPLLAIGAGLLMAITLLAGGYPAYFVSQFSSITSIKGSGIPDEKGGGQFLRKALVTFQLMVACLLLTGSLMLVKQLDYLKDRPLGFQKDHIITIPIKSQNLNSFFERGDSTFQIRLETFRDRIETYASVYGTCVSSASPGLGAIYRGAIPEGFSQEDNLFVASLGVDFDFMKTFDVPVVAGRAFDKTNGADKTESFMVNEAAIREFHWISPENAIGKTINREGKKGKVIGVFRDFHMASLTTPMSALILDISAVPTGDISIRFKNSQVTNVIDQLRREWTDLFPEKTFEFSFLDQRLNEQYADFQNFGKIIQSFTLLAVLISCLGVYGLVLFVVRRKVKEIGVRKVSGSSVGGILRLIYKDFAWLMSIGFLLAVPLSYFFMNKWLSNFSFHATIDILMYMESFVLVFMIVTATISYQAIKAAMANPVHSLRTE